MKTATNTERLNELFDKDPRNDSAIADALHVSKQAVCAWRNGTRSPKKSMIIQIANMYNVDIGWLMGYDDDPADEPVYKELHTVEARILARGIDKLPPKQREQTLAITEGIAPQTVKKVMRWSSTRMLDRYAHPSQQDALNAVDSIGVANAVAIDDA